MKRSVNSPLKNRLWKNLLLASIVLVLLLVLTCAFRVQILTGVANFLVVNDRLQQADMIFVLNGDVETRPFRASELYNQGLAPIIGIARIEKLPVEDLGLIPSETDVAIGVMKKLGVPSEKIIVFLMEGGVTSTFDEADLLRKYVEANNLHKVILVTSAFHTRRTKWIFERELSALPVTIEMAAVPYREFDETNWWRSEAGLINLNNEYIKLAYYFLKYR